MAATMRFLTDVKGCAAARPACANKRATAVVPRAVHGLRNSSGLNSSSSAASQQQVCSSAAPLQSRRAAHVTRVAAQEALVEAAKGTQTWYALVASAEWYLNDVQNEAIAEQLRERVRYFKEQGRDLDFYLVPNPAWLDARFPDQGKQVGRPSLALVSTDKKWITFMRVRLDRVLQLDLAGVPEAEVLAAGAALPEFKKPAKWTAPYPPYSAGWWEVFYPNAAK